MFSMLNEKNANPIKVGLVRITLTQHAYIRIDVLFGYRSIIESIISFTNVY